MFFHCFCYPDHMLNWPQNHAKSHPEPLKLAILGANVTHLIGNLAPSWHIWPPTWPLLNPSWRQVGMTSPILGQSSPNFGILEPCCAKQSPRDNFGAILGLFWHYFGSGLEPFWHNLPRISLTQRAVRGAQALQKRPFGLRKKERCGVRLPFRRRKTGSHRIPIYLIHWCSVLKVFLEIAPEIADCSIGSPTKQPQVLSTEDFIAVFIYSLTSSSCNLLSGFRSYI